MKPPLSKQGDCMETQREFYSHVTGGTAGDATALMCRIALNIGHDPKAYPVDISEIKKFLAMHHFPDGCGVNELFVADFLRAALMGAVKPWRPEQVESLRTMNGVHATATLHAIKPMQNID